MRTKHFADHDQLIQEDEDCTSQMGVVTQTMPNSNSGFSENQDSKRNMKTQCFESFLCPVNTPVECISAYHHYQLILMEVLSFATAAWW